jgi:hypothetical protein
MTSGGCAPQSLWTPDWALPARPADAMNRNMNKVLPDFETPSLLRNLRVRGASRPTKDLTGLSPTLAEGVVNRPQHPYWGTTRSSEVSPVPATRCARSTSWTQQALVNPKFHRQRGR